MGVTWAFFQERAEWRVNLEGHRKQKVAPAACLSATWSPSRDPPFQSLWCCLLVLVRSSSWRQCAGLLSPYSFYYLLAYLELD